MSRSLPDTLASFVMAELSFPLDQFHSGNRRVLVRCYEDYFQTVEQAVGTLLTGADKETVVQDVFFRLLTDGEFRRTFQGGSLASWLRTVARNRAIDYRRRYYERERSIDSEDDPGIMSQAADQAPDIEGQVEARIFFERLRRLMPHKLLSVFEKRFVDGLSQREAASELDMSRTTLAYREVLIRRILRRALRNGEIE